MELAEDQGAADQRQDRIAIHEIPRAVTVTLITSILLCGGANALNQADRNIMPIAVIPMAAELNYTTWQRGWVLSSFAYGYIVSQLPSGYIATRVPPLKLLLGAVLLWSVSTIATPFAARINLTTLFGCRAIMGVAEGLCLPAIFQHFANTVPEARRSGAFAFMIACGAVGQLIALLFCPLIETWSWMFTSFGAAGLLWCIACATLSGRSGAGAVETEGTDSQTRTDSDAHALMSEPSPPTEAAKGALATCSIFRRLLSTGAVNAIVVAHFAQNWTNYTISAWLPTYLHDALGVPTKQLWMTALPFAVNALSGVRRVHPCGHLNPRDVCFSVGGDEREEGVGGARGRGEDGSGQR